jgi:hypothetical protein
VGWIILTTDNLRWTSKHAAYLGQLLSVEIQARLPCGSGVAFRKQAQLRFRHREFRGATIQTDNKLWKCPHDGLINVFQPREMDAHLRAELPLVG